MSQSIKQAEVGDRRFRRLLTRALIVAGSSIATTAAAWALTAGSASAAELEVQGPLSAISDTVENPAPIGRAASAVEDGLSESPGLPTSSHVEVGKVAGDIHGTVTKVSQAVKPQLAELTEAAPLPALSNPLDDSPSLAMPNNEKSQAQDLLPTSVALSSDTNSVLQSLPLAAVPADDNLQSDAPALPAENPFTPPSPASFPAHCVCGDGGSASGKNLAAIFGSSDYFSVPLAGLLRSTLVQIPAGVGEDSGNTPD